MTLLLCDSESSIRNREPVTYVGVHPQGVHEMGAEELVQRVGRRQAALRGHDVGLDAGVRAQVMRHQLMSSAVEAAERRFDHLPHLHGVRSWVMSDTISRL